MPNKYIFTIDLDDTLLNRKHEASRDSVNWIIDALSLGNIIAINTGRGQKFIEKYVYKLFPYHYHCFIYSTQNGSYIYSFDEHKNIKTLSTNNLEQNIAKEIIDLAISKKYYLHLNDNYLFYGKKSISKNIFSKFGKMHKEKFLNKETYTHFSKIQLFSLKKSKNEKFVQEITKKYKQVSAVTTFKRYAVEITDKNANKGLLIHILKKSFSGYKVVALGDSGNDLVAFDNADYCYVPSTSEKFMQRLPKVEVLDNQYNTFVANAIKKRLGYDKPMIIAHRGGAKNNLENTLEAFTYAYSLREKIKKLGSDIQFETDVRLTKDLQLLVFHDDDLNRLVGIDKKISDLNCNDIKKIINEKYPKYNLITFEEMLVKFPNVNRIYVEIKDLNNTELAIKKMFELIKKYNRFEQIVITSESNLVATKIRYEIDNQKIFVRTSSSTREATSFILKNKFKLFKLQIRSTTLDLPIKEKRGFVFNLHTKSIVEMAKKYGYQLSYWDWEKFPITKLEAQKMVANNVYGIMIDDLEMLIKLYEKTN